MADVEPGSVHGLTVAREHVLGAPYWAASQLGLPTLAGGGYDGPGIGVYTPVKQPTVILLFATDLSVPFTNCAERACRPVKIQQRTSGGRWRTLAGLAGLAIVQSYLDTATKWGLDKLDALHHLFTAGAWLPPALTPGK